MFLYASGINSNYISEPIGAYKGDALLLWDMNKNVKILFRYILGLK